MLGQNGWTQRVIAKVTGMPQSSVSEIVTGRRVIDYVLLATIHVRAGEPDGLRLAHGAITGVSKLSSVRARRTLQPLAAALQARPGNDHRQLAHMAHHVATT